MLSIRTVMLLMAALLLNCTSPAWADDSPALIQVLDPSGIPVGRPYRVTAKVTDADGIDRVRWYFRAAGSEHYAFVDLKPSDGEFSGYLPAPAATTSQIEEVVLVRDDTGHLTQSKFFETPVTAAATAPASGGAPVAVYSEISPAPLALPGFEGDYLVKGVSDNRKYGVIAGLVSAKAANYQGEVPVPATTVEMTEKKGLSTGAMLGIAAGGVAAIALVAGSSGGGGGGDSGTDTSSNAQDELTGTVQVKLKWSNIADVDLHVIDPCGNRIDHLLRSATCQGFTGTLDRNANDEHNDAGVVTDPEENITWADGAPRGKYTVRVRMQDNRGQGSTLVDVSVKDGDQPIHEASTTLCATEGCDAYTTFVY